MATVRQLNGFIAVFLYLGCFFLAMNQRPNQRRSPPKRRKLVPLSSSPPLSSPSLNSHKSISLSIRSYLTHIFTFSNKHQQPQPTPPTDPISTPHFLQQPQLHLSPDRQEVSADMAIINRGSFSSRTEIFPCPTCDEVLSKPHLLDLHQATKHALSELGDGESGKNIVAIIFESGWMGTSIPAVHRVLKVHNTPRTLARFEEYRELVRSRAGVDERCSADGNERLRFYCSATLCSLTGGACGSQYCSTCAIVRHGFNGKQVDLDGIATHATSWDAHCSLPEDLEEEFAFLHVRRAMLVCRVIAGRVARCGGIEEEKGAFDSVVPMRLRAGRRSSWGEEDELLVFNPRALLPCFIILYSAA